jgi:hypothetical protein
VKAGVLAEFASAEGVLEALAVLRRNGFRRLESYTPYPVEGADDRLGLGRSRLPRFIFGGGVLGAVLGYGIQWYANVWDYPQSIGGRPVHAVAAFIPATFEATVLCAALVAFFGLFVALRLPELWHPVFEIDGFERASVDRFWVGVDARDRRFDGRHVTELLEGLHPLRVVPIAEDA